MTLRSPALATLLLAPVLGEGLSTATPPSTLLLPWNLALFVALYGCGALLVRELARRRRLGVLGFVLLAAAYGVYEEALVDRFWFTPSYWRDTGIGGYAEVWHTNLLLAVHLTVFHVAVSVGATIVVVERLFPERSGRPWVGPRGLALAAVTLLVVPPALYGQYDLRPWPQLVAAVVLTAGLVGAALLAPRVPSRVLATGRCRRPGWIAFVCTGAHFVLTYAGPSTGLPWPLGTTLALVPVVLGVALLRRCVDAVAVLTGVLSFFAVLCLLIGLLGRYDTAVLGLVALLGLWWLRARGPATPSP